MSTAEDLAEGVPANIVRDVRQFVDARVVPPRHSFLWHLLADQTLDAIAMAPREWSLDTLKRVVRFVSHAVHPATRGNPTNVGAWGNGSTPAEAAQWSTASRRG